MKVFSVFLGVFLSALSLQSSAQNDMEFGTDTKTSVSYQGNVITIYAHIDTLEVIDPETGKSATLIKKREKVALFNDKTIYHDGQASEPVGAAAQSTLKEYLRTNLLLEELEKARRLINNIDIVIDENGKVVYVKVKGQDQNELKDAAVIKSIEQKLNTKTFIPAHKDNKAVPYGVNLFGLY
jgi:uncharacterized protein YuzE